MKQELEYCIFGFPDRGKQKALKKAPRANFRGLSDLPFGGNCLNVRGVLLYDHALRRHRFKHRPPRLFQKSLALLLGAIAAAVPLAAGLLVATDPLRRKASARLDVKVTTLDALPADGVPRRFPVIAARTDAWNRFDAAPVGAVYLRRTADGKVEALNVVCPHAGCFVDYVAGSGTFRCPCHQSSFGVDGKIADTRSPSPRGLDSLAVDVKDDGSVWVAFQNFQAGRPDKVPVA